MTCRGGDDKKFFMKQGLSFQSGTILGAARNQYTATRVDGSFCYKAEFRYDMEDYLVLRGAFPKQEVQIVEDNTPIDLTQD